jgi:hypothetical protein
MQQRNLALAEARREKTMQRVREQQRVTIKLSHVDYDAMTGRRAAVSKPHTFG